MKAAGLLIAIAAAVQAQPPTITDPRDAYVRRDTHAEVAMEQARYQGARGNNYGYYEGRYYDSAPLQHDRAYAHEVPMRPAMPPAMPPPGLAAEGGYATGYLGDGYYNRQYAGFYDAYAYPTTPWVLPQPAAPAAALPYKASPYAFYNRPANPALASGVVGPYYTQQYQQLPFTVKKQAVPFGQAVPDQLANNVTTFACGQLIDSCQLLLTKYGDRIPCQTQFDCTAIDPSTSCVFFTLGTNNVPDPNSKDPLNPLNLIGGREQFCTRCCADTALEDDVFGIPNRFACTNAAPIKRNLGLQTFNHPFCCANTESVCGVRSTTDFSLTRSASGSSGTRAAAPRTASGMGLGPRIEPITTGTDGDGFRTRPPMQSPPPDVPRLPPPPPASSAKEHRGVVRGSSRMTAPSSTRFAGVGRG